MKKGDNKKELYLWGGLLGLGLGVISAYLFNRAVEENSGEEKVPLRLSSGDIVKLGLLLLGAVRQIAELGATTGKGEEK